MKWSAIAVMLLVAGCSDADTRAEKDIAGWVQKGKVGGDVDQWIEMQNIDGSWSKTGLIFGYADDEGECEKAIAGLKRVNYARQYRCAQANF